MKTTYTAQKLLHCLAGGDVSRATRVTWSGNRKQRVVYPVYVDWWTVHSAGYGVFYRGPTGNEQSRTRFQRRRLQVSFTLKEDLQPPNWTELNCDSVQFSSAAVNPLYTQFTPPELTRQNRWVSSFVASVKAMWIGQLLATCSVFRFVRLECPIYNVRLVRNRVIREPHDAGAYRGVWHYRARAQLINWFAILWLK